MPPSVLSSIKRYLHPPQPDLRGRRFVAVIECLLNQNARDDGAASVPAPVDKSGGRQRSIRAAGHQTRTDSGV